MGDFTEPLCPDCSNNSDIQGEDERMEKIIDKAGGRPIFKGTGFYETDYVQHENKRKFYQHEEDKTNKKEYYNPTTGQIHDRKTNKVKRSIHASNDKDRYIEQQKKHNKKLDQSNKK